MSTHQISRRRNVALWIAQILLAALFLFAGGFKLVAPASQLAQQSPIFAPAFLKFIGACEVLGAVGLIVPALTRIRPGLTPLAAALLIIILIGATVSTAMYMPVALPAPIIVGLLTAYVAYGRWRLAPIESKSA